MYEGRIKEHQFKINACACTLDKVKAELFSTVLKLTFAFRTVCVSIFISMPTEPQNNAPDVLDTP